MEEQGFKENFNRTYEVLGICGKGAYGTIYKIQDRSTKKLFALKEIKYNENEYKELTNISLLPSHYNIRKYQTFHIGSRIDSLQNLLKKNSNKFREDQIKSSGSKKTKRTNLGNVLFSNSTDLKSIRPCSPILFARKAKNIKDEVKKHNRKYIYIISDFCKLTLRKFIDLRNQIINNERSLSSTPLIVQKGLIVEDNKISINRPFITCLFTDIVRGIRFLHDNNIMHRDLKPDNIFFENDYQNVPKIGDFGSIKFCKQSSQDFSLFTINIGTTTYNAPEISSSFYNKNIDVYSLGLIYFELICPFKTEIERVYAFEKLRNNGKILSGLKSNFDAECDVIEQCLVHNPVVRPTSKKLFHNVFNFNVKRDNDKSFFLKNSA
ncbi:PEK protein kinase [Edhazardia aedis USNM 41457]|uniref:PEK protein kinase n=1 Tax=Edhazardia aedis (strain USNM 41457) TaxID=1003232 RepID=J9DP48_EDHAE|nr:PEK protein kinase [Edhazardia aedis USNM 41457]|eukprot:EJW04325.1 PEK protein kinase [Edhazardia aedis USNM 41457]